MPHHIAQLASMRYRWLPIVETPPLHEREKKGVRSAVFLGKRCSVLFFFSTEKERNAFLANQSVSACLLYSVFILRGSRKPLLRVLGLLSVYVFACMILHSKLHAADPIGSLCYSISLLLLLYGVLGSIHPHLSLIDRR